MRLKLYYTADEIVPDLYTSGKEWMTTDNVQYVGLYHRYTTGETYTDATWNSKSSVKLIPFREPDLDVNKYQKIKQLKLKYGTPSSRLVTPTAQQIQQGEMPRYFIKKINETQILEIDVVQYQAWLSKKIDQVLYTAVQITWYISGNVTDAYDNGTLIRGVVTKNQLQLASVEPSIPGITNRLANLIEFYSDTTYNVPRDINE
jgi:hypothetical protein